MSKTLVLFDFDGTMTRKDTFPAFIFFVFGRLKGILGFLIHSPYILFYYLGILNGSALKQKVVSYFFKGKDVEAINKKGIAFSEELNVKEMNIEVMNDFMQYQLKGFDLCIVSASLDVWIAPFAKIYNIKYICTETEVSGNKFTGKLKTPNCNGKEKANRIKAVYNLSEYENIIAYGNSKGDEAMMNLAKEKHMV